LINTEIIIFVLCSGVKSLLAYWRLLAHGFQLPQALPDCLGWRIISTLMKDSQIKDLYHISSTGLELWFA
jgi:hypothetical protein